MGINSTEVAYQFGQFGCAITDGAAPIFPPKGYVIVAIQFLAEGSTLHATLGLTSDIVYDSAGRAQKLWLDSDTAVHATGNVQDADAHNDNGSNDAYVITLDSAALNIKPGMIVEHDTMCPRSLTDPYRVVSVDATNPALITLDKLVAANYASGSAAKKATFFDEHSVGFGGLELDAEDSFPAGTTIFGRWTRAMLSGAGNGRMICYFGK